MEGAGRRETVTGGERNGDNSGEDMEGDCSSDEDDGGAFDLHLTQPSSFPLLMTVYFMLILMFLCDCCCVASVLTSTNKFE